MGLCVSKPEILTHHHMVDRVGSGHFTIDENGKIDTKYNLRSKNDFQASEKLRQLERKMFKECCANPALDHKPRENLQKHFCQYNSPQQHGPIPTPPLRVTSNPRYQATLAKGLASV